MLCSTAIMEIFLLSGRFPNKTLDIFQNNVYLNMDAKLSIEARRFKKVREELNHTQQYFAEILGIGATTADIERGKTKLSGKVVMELLRQFNINPLWLFGESYNKIVNINGGDVSPKVITLDVDQNDTIALVNQKAAAGYPHNVQDVEWYETLPGTRNRALLTSGGDSLVMYLDII